ncbi:MAG: potassium transporter TrkG [Pseudomonadota bacterium]
MLAWLTQLPLLVVLLGITGVMNFVPALHALALRQHQVAQDFLYSGLIILVGAMMLAIATLQQPSRNAARSHLTALVAAYLVLPVVMALPILQILPDTRFVNAWFEMMSAFTTTGASLYDPARLPPSVHLWRGMVGWFGGFFILLAAYAILAPMNLGGVEVISGRVPGRGAQGATQITRVADPAERVGRYALTLFPVYGGLTLMLWVGLMIAGLPALEAVCLAMGTLSTSGILVGAPGQTVPPGLLAEGLIFCFLFLSVSRRIMPGSGFVDRTTPVWRDPELRLVIALLCLVPAVLFVRHWLAWVELPGPAPDIATAGAAVWGALFTTLSFLTTTGYQSSSWATAQWWSGLGAPGVMLMGLAIIGGGVATTAGGVKLLRVYSLFRHGERELERIVHPSSVGGQGSQARRLRREGAYLAWVFFMLFGIAIAVVTALLTLTGVAFEPALVLTLAALTTTGPLVDVATTPPISYADLDSAAKVVLAAAMVVGRLETLALLALLAPANWRK